MGIYQLGYSESWINQRLKSIESKTVAKQGGDVAKVALKELEAKTGKKIVGRQKFLIENKRKKK